jgi:hypothetical protein
LDRVRGHDKLPQSQPGFTILDPLRASLLGLWADEKRNLLAIFKAGFGGTAAVRMDIVSHCHPERD